jgi:methylmalonyl-CoA/ethylmalonyl-CoA epimerase
MSLRVIDHVWFWVADLDRAVAFYRDVLGLKLLYRTGDEWAEFEAGPIRLGLHGPGSARHRASGGAVVFRVEDLDATRRELERRGVRFEEREGEVQGYARFVHFADLDGNGLGIIEYQRDRR